MKATLAKQQINAHDRNNDRLSDKLNSAIIYFDCDRQIEALRIETYKSRNNYGCWIKAYNPPNVILEGNARGDTESEAIVKAFASIELSFDRPLGYQSSGLRKYTPIDTVLEAIASELEVKRGEKIEVGYRIYNI